MSGTFGGFDPKGFDISNLGSHFGANLSSGLGDVLDKLRGAFDPRADAPTVAGGDARAAVLALLAEQDRHGSELIALIAERSGGSYAPGPGEIYPTLQLLVDEGLVAAEDVDGRKRYALTESGHAAAATGAPAWTPREKRFGQRAGALGSAGFELAQAVAQVGRTGTSEQVTQAVEILDEARRRLHGLLSQD